MKKILGTLVGVGTLLVATAVGATPASATNIQQAWATTTLAQTAPSTMTATGCLSTQVSVSVYNVQNGQGNGSISIMATDSCDASAPFSGNLVFSGYTRSNQSATVDTGLASATDSTQFDVNVFPDGPMPASISVTWTGVGKISNVSETNGTLHWVIRSRPASVSAVIDLSGQHLVMNGSGQIGLDIITTP